MKKVLYIITLAAVAASMTGCGSKAETSGSAVTAAASETTTTAASETTTVTTTTVTTTTTAEEPAAAPNETMTSETTEAAPAQTTAAGDLDLDAMMSSIEAEIPDITVFTGFNDIDVTVTYPKHDDSEGSTATTTSAAANTETTTTTTAAPSTASAPVTDMFSFNFDGVTYKMPVSGSQLQLPDGWVDGTSSGRSDRIYNKNGFDGCHIEEVHRGGDTLNGVYVHVVNDLQDGKPVPALSMAGGISWGATKEQIKAAFGEPVRESAYNQYNTTTTALFYSSDEGDTMVLYVPENCGLALIELYRY